MLKGKVWKFGDYVDADSISPSVWAEERDPSMLAKHCMERLDPEFPRKAKKGDLVVVGRWFGYGSSHVNCALALKGLGIGAIMAESITGKFHRMLINYGIPALECPGITGSLDEGNMVKVDLKDGVVENLTKGGRLRCKPLHTIALEILDAGGWKEFTRRRMLQRSSPDQAPL